VCPTRIKRSFSLRLLYHVFSDSYLYGPLQQCSTETQDGRNKLISNAIQHTIGINPSKDIHVRIQNNLAFSLIQKGLHCFKVKMILQYSEGFTLFQSKNDFSIFRV
jgi:hypothetical protein